MIDFGEKTAATSGLGAAGGSQYGSNEMYTSGRGGGPLTGEAGLSKGAGGDRGGEGPGSFFGQGGDFDSLGARDILCPWLRIPLTKRMLLSGSVSAFVGMLLGIVAALIVNCTLVEISLSSFFSVYLGFVFVVVGVAILWRINSKGGLGSSVSDACAGGANDVFGDDICSRRRRFYLSFFGGLIILSGVLCFVLTEKWFVTLPSVLKIPIYMTLGVSVSFALIFSLIDMTNYVFSIYQSALTKPVVESHEQSVMILLYTVIMGGSFGLIFGAMGVEDEVSYHIKLALLREQVLCYPIGAVIGGMAGFSNQVIRLFQQQNHTYLPDFDEDI